MLFITIVAIFINAPSFILSERRYCVFQREMPVRSSGSRPGARGLPSPFWIMPWVWSGALIVSELARMTKRLCAVLDIRKPSDPMDTLLCRGAIPWVSAAAVRTTGTDQVTCICRLTYP